MYLFFYLAVFGFGASIGSFLNCVIYRLHTGESFLKGRSHCPHCGHILKWQDLIPLFSFLILKGRCRYCWKKISLQYPLVEFFTGVLFLVPVFSAYLINGRLLNMYDLLFYWLSICFLLIIFAYDLKHYIIPDKVIYPAIALGLIFNFQFLISNQFSIFKFSILSALGASAFFLAIVLISRGHWMGLGDVKLVFFLGLLLGFPNILAALFLSFLIGAIIGTGLVLTGRKTFKSEVPFGPFLITGALIALFWGEKIINWYLRLLV